MITRQLQAMLLAKHAEILKKPETREWHRNEILCAENIRQTAAFGRSRLNDGKLASILYDRWALPGDVGQAWSHGVPNPVIAPFPAVKPEIARLLLKVAKCRPISKAEYVRFRTAVGAAGIPPAVANRFVASCFPSQFVTTVVDAQMNTRYRKLLAANIVAVKNTPEAEAKDWFDQNTTVVKWIKEALPNTDDAWRSVLVWCL